mmetsp:Transcript_43311/g.123944  ORF Transcript_43311/g.123944 Transcript_43311/m.123944 type:complete len:117 (-) Transcript_43311:90-440(-)
MIVSSLLKKLAMLDVAVVGIYLVTYCMAIYANIGVLVTRREGIVVLFGAEVVHNLLYWIVSSVADYPAEAASYLAAAIEESPTNEDCAKGCGGLNCFFDARLCRWLGGGDQGVCQP